MTDKDKVREYDRIADYLRKQGWKVAYEWEHPIHGFHNEVWHRKDLGGNYGIMAAYRIECYKDAPKQGERMTENLRKLRR